MLLAIRMTSNPQHLLFGTHNILRNTNWSHSDRVFVAHQTSHVKQRFNMFALIRGVSPSIATTCCATLCSIKTGEINYYCHQCIINTRIDFFVYTVHWPKIRIPHLSFYIYISFCLLHYIYSHHDISISNSKWSRAASCREYVVNVILRSIIIFLKSKYMMIYEC